MDIGYIRVSGVDQNTVRQESAFDGLNLNKVFEDKASGKDVHRPALERCLEVLRDGDTLHVHSIDRLARNMQDLLSLLSDLTGRGVSVKFHKENLTFTPDKENPFQRLQLQLIGSVAEFEGKESLLPRPQGSTKAASLALPLNRWRNYASVLKRTAKRWLGWRVSMGYQGRRSMSI